MNPKVRMIIFLIGALGIAGIYALCVLRLRDQGGGGPEDIRNRYLVAINSRTVPERNCTDAVSAVNFDYRGFDTCGEEFILFVSVVGATVLLRQAEEKKVPLRPDAITKARDVAPSDAMRVWILGMVGPKVLLGIYIVSHGQLTPGGGFQGGVVLATAALILYLGEGFKIFKRVVPHTIVEVAEAGGAAGYVLIGTIGWFVGKEFLANVLPMGTSGEITAAGTMPLISATTGLEVAAGFTLLLFAFLQETLVLQEEK